MAIRGAPCSWELPKIDMLGFSGMTQDVYETIYGRALEPNTTRKHSGNSSVYLDGGDALYAYFNSHVEPFSGSATKKRWTGFHSPEVLWDPEVDDEVFVAQLTHNANLIVPADRKHLVLLALVVQIAGVYKFQYRLSILEIVGGTLTFTTLVTDATQIDPSAVSDTDWYMYTIEYDAPNAEGGSGGLYGIVQLFIGLNGSPALPPSVGSWPLSLAQKSGLQLESYHCLDTRTADGKGATLLRGYHDDVIPNDDQDGGLTARPTFALGSVRADVCNGPGKVEEVSSGTVYGTRLVSGETITGAVDKYAKIGSGSSFINYGPGGYGDASGTIWWGYGLHETPESPQQGWDTALFNDMYVQGCDYVNVIGDNLVLAGCPVPTFGARQVGGVQPVFPRPEVLPYHHH